MSFYRYLRAASPNLQSLESFRSILLNHSASLQYIRDEKVAVSFFFGGHTGTVEVPLENTLSALSLRCFAVAKTLDELRFSAEHAVDFGGDVVEAMSFARKMQGELEEVAVDLAAA